jgi:hypothetical protein
MTNDTNDELLAAARQLLRETTTRFDRLLHTESGYPRADAILDDFEGVIREVASGLNDWLRAYDSFGDVGHEEHLEETRQREHDRQQPEA